jgi:hypothetical protein
MGRSPARVRTGPLSHVSWTSLQRISSLEDRLVPALWVLFGVLVAIQVWLHR